jgi:hypothetical protein
MHGRLEFHIRDKLLEVLDVYGIVQHTTPAGLFAESHTYPAAHRRQRIVFPDHGQSLGITPRTDEFDVSGNVQMHGAGLDARGRDLEVILPAGSANRIDHRVQKSVPKFIDQFPDRDNGLMPHLAHGTCPDHLDHPLDGSEILFPTVPVADPGQQIGDDPRPGPAGKAFAAGCLLNPTDIGPGHIHGIPPGTEHEKSLPSGNAIYRIVGHAPTHLAEREQNIPGFGRQGL